MIVTWGQGNPRQPIVSLLKEHRITVLPVVAAVGHAVRMEEEGADAVIASGMEAGGHVGTVCSLPLIPQVVSAVKIPVVAAGVVATRMDKELGTHYMEAVEDYRQHLKKNGPGYYRSHHRCQREQEPSTLNAGTASGFLCQGY